MVSMYEFCINSKIKPVLYNIISSTYTKAYHIRGSVASTVLPSELSKQHPVVSQEITTFGIKTDIEFFSTAITYIKT